MHQFTVEEKDSGQRLDKFIARLIPLAPKSFLYKALRNKDIRLNGKKAQGDEKLQAGDTVLFRFPDVQYADLGGKENAAKKNVPEEIAAKENTFGDISAWKTEEGAAEKQNPDTAGEKKFPERFGRILYEDEDIILADKKAGILSQKAAQEDESINEALLSYCGGKTALFTPSVCNRLDRNTSGLIVFAKTYKGAREMTGALKDRSAKKYYLAAVRGNVTEAGHLKARLKKEEKTNQVTVLPAESAEGDLIETAYVPVAHTAGKGEDATLLKIDLLTGKTHQIRAHLASVGMPVLGDAKYGVRGDGEKYRTNRMMLHSYEILLPGRGKFRTPVPAAFFRLFPGFYEEER